MCDGGLPGVGELAGLSGAGLIDAVTGWARAAAAAEAHKLAAVAEVQRRACDAAEHPQWCCDDLDAAAAALSCALTISHGKALGQFDLAVTLRDRLPKVGARFLAGQIPLSLVTTIAFRTALVTESALAALDAALAGDAAAWGPLSAAKLDQAIDVWVDRFDPDAVRRIRATSRGRSFTVGDYTDEATGTVAVFGRLWAVDAALIEQRLQLMMHSVCADDPRTLAQRRADALGALANLSGFLACRCDNPDCAAKIDDGRASSVVIHLIAEQQSLDTAVDPDLHGRGHDPRPHPAPAPEPDPEPDAESDATAEGQAATAESPPAPAPESDAEGDAPTRVTAAVKPAPEQVPVVPEEAAAAAQSSSRRKAALIPGAKGAVVPAVMLADLIAHGAVQRFIDSDGCGFEDRYRPSAALQRFVRNRDLTCRFPGCDKPAAYTDIDHTVPYPVGPTHPANIKCYCRIHHLVKTFWDGFTDRQHRDGTLVITTPTGHTYTTKPFANLVFPQWNTTTAPPPTTYRPTPPPNPGRTLMMPTRRRTRAQTRAARITRERKLNAEQRALEQAAAAAAAAERKAKREALQRAIHRDDNDHFACFDYFDHLDQPRPPGYQPDYGDDPPPF